MANHDTMLKDDARYHSFRHYQSVFPLPAWGSLAKWKKERKAVRAHLWLCSGLNEATRRWRPKGRVISTFEHEGLLIENISIETLPGLYVQGNLYRRKDLKGNRLPLVLNPHGHGDRSRSGGGKSAGTPPRAVNQAQQGFAAFAWSMIGMELDTKQLMHRTLLQGHNKQLCNLYGLSMFGLQLNNSMKVLDYLSARPDIDGARVGCTGASGGGTQTYYLAALDERVTVAAPCVMLSSHFQGGCVCENAPLLHLKYSTVHYAALIAPRPLLLSACTGDWTHHQREREYARLKELYELYGREDAIACFYQDERHNYNQRSREHVYAWLGRWLQDGSPTRKRIPESKTPAPKPEQLLVFDTPVPPRQRAFSSQAELETMWQRFHRKPASKEESLATLQLEVPGKKDLLVRGMTPRYAQRSGSLKSNHITYGRFSEDSSLSCHFVLPQRGKRCVIQVHDYKDLGEWRRAVNRPPKPVRDLLKAGHGVLLPLLFGQSGMPEARALCE